jgi:hypothetical protein
MFEPGIACFSPKFERGIADLPLCTRSTLIALIAYANFSLHALHLVTQYELDMVQLPVSLPSRDEGASWPQLRSRVRSASLRISQYPVGTVASLPAECDTVI